MSVRFIGGIAAALWLASAAFAAESGASLADVASSGDTAAVRDLLAKKPDVNAAQPDGSTALHYVVRADDLQTAELLIRAGANAKVANSHGVTPLHLAALNGSAAMIGKLLDAGADANAPNPQGETPLMIAAHTGNPDAIRALLDRGAAINTKEHAAQQTALMYAIHEGHTDAVKLLIERGADVNTSTPLVEKPSVTTGNLQGIGRAQNSPAPVPQGGMTPLLIAARDGKLEIARMLVAAGAEVNHTEAIGASPLLLAILNNHVDLARFLLEKGANPNATDTFGRAALWAAVDLRNLDLDSRNMENGVDRESVLPLIPALLDRGADPNAMLLKEPPSRRWMIQFGASQWVNPAGQTPFIRAAAAGDVASMKLLLARGADPNLRTKGNTTALMAAAGVGWVPTQSYTESKESVLEAVKLCIEKGADVNAVNDTKYTAVHGAAYRGLDAVIQYLASKGAKLDVKTQQGQTPLAFAEGVYLGGKPPEHRASTIALLRKLTSGAQQ
jgi:ankyrin repeat protein